MLRRFRGVLAVGVVVFIIPAHSAAQSALEDSVANRSRADFSPIGIELDELLGIVGLVDQRTIEQKNSPLSSFVVMPSFGINGTYTSNVFLTEDDAVGDKRVEYSPGVSVQSDWGRHSLSFTAAATIVRHTENTGEDFEEFQLQADGSLNIYDDKTLSAVAGILRRREGRDAEDDPGQAAGPTISITKFADLTFNYTADPILVNFKLELEHDDFLENGSISNDERDLSSIDLTLRLGYEFSPGTTIFVEPNADFRIFDQSRDNQGVLQNNYGYGGLVGITWDLTGVTFAEFGVGVAHRVYENPLFQSQTNLDFSGKLIWNATDVISLTSNLTRNTTESTTAGESGVLTTTWSNTVDYEFLNNVIVTGTASFGISDNQETRRRDRDISFSGGVNYLITENWAANLNLGYDLRRSNVDDEGFRDFSASLGLTARL